MPLPLVSATPAAIVPRIEKGGMNMRPKPIVWFELLSLAALALGVLAAILSWGGAVPGVGGRAAEGSGVAIATGLTLALTLALILLTSRKRNSVAKWILVVLVVAALVMQLPQLGELLGGGIAGLASVASSLLQVAALCFLFTADARRWFAGGGLAADADRAA